jgi:hypothetical protein
MAGPFVARYRAIVEPLFGRQFTEADGISEAELDAIPGRSGYELPEANEEAEPRKNTRVIAVLFPNDQTVNYNWAQYRTTARAIEKKTGLRFFRALPDDVAEALRDHVDEVEVREPAPRRGTSK